MTAEVELLLCFFLSFPFTKLAIYLLNNSMHLKHSYFLLLMQFWSGRNYKPLCLILPFATREGIVIAVELSPSGHLCQN